VKFFRWATDRLGGRDGIVCFVSNNGFIDQTAFDGMRKHLLRDFDRIDHLDLHGNVRRNPKLSGTTHNVFGIQVGVGITLAIRKQGATARLRYYRVPEMWRKGEKLESLEKRSIEWQTLTPDSRHTWLVPDNAEEYAKFPAVTDMFDLWTLGVGTNRDSVVYDWNREKLRKRILNFIPSYNTEVHRHKADPGADWPDHIDWSEALKLNVQRGNLAKFEEGKIVPSLYRPFTRQWLYFDRILNERVYQWPKISGRFVGMPGLGNRKPFGALISDFILPRDLAFEKAQCFPLSRLKNSAVEQFRQHYSSDRITKEDVFHYLYALLHHPGYRERYAANLKHELPRIPFAPAFAAFATAGKELARLHVEYESLAPWPLVFVENKPSPIPNT